MHHLVNVCFPFCSFTNKKVNPFDTNSRGLSAQPMLLHLAIVLWMLPVHIIKFLQHQGKPKKKVAWIPPPMLLSQHWIHYYGKH
mmetsp:Transcript_7161/g.8916  ORF Transcript_7161/g.8916 Transcript_7161/m.8916 type:complete len:84 (+) Transcript_7161:363-614(+)